MMSYEFPGKLLDDVIQQLINDPEDQPVVGETMKIISDANIVLPEAQVIVKGADPSLLIFTILEDEQSIPEPPSALMQINYSGGKIYAIAFNSQALDKYRKLSAFTFKGVDYRLIQVK